MFRLLSKVIHSPRYYKFANTYKYSSSQEWNKTIDVLRLEFDNNGYFINFPGRTMPIPLDMSVSEAQLELLTKYGFGEMHFYNKDGIQYSVSTPLQILIQDDFYISLEDQRFYIVNTLNSHNLTLGVNTQHDVQFDYKKIKDLTQLGGNTFEQQNILQEFLGSFVDQLKKDSKEMIDRQHINLIMNNTLNKMSIQNSHRIAQLESLISVVEKRLGKELGDKKELEETYVDKKMKKFFKRFFALVLCQIGLIQYGTYVFISWDFMEPITCLLGISDAILAYGYWLYVNKQYGYETITQRKQESLRKRKFYTEEVDENEIFARKDILDYLYRQKYYRSSSLAELLKMLADTKEFEKYYLQNISLNKQASK